MPRFLLLDSACGARSLLEPCKTATALPSRSVASAIFDVFLTANCVPVIQNGIEKSTWSRRARVMVVVPHSMSTPPLATCAMRLAVVPGAYTTFTSLPMVFFTSSTIRLQRSTEKPATFFCSSKYENGTADSRWPMLIWARSAMRVRVGDELWAKAHAENSKAPVKPRQLAARCGCG